jgi:undecaprenyl-diphosphatase
MKLSWSHKLFLRINTQIGKHHWLDLFMIFCAKWLIIILFIGVFIIFHQSVVGHSYFNSVLFLLIYIVIGFGISQAVGFFYQRKRPVVDLPNVKTLVETLSTWKSFPSDHSLISFLMAFYILAHFPMLGVLYLFCAVLVAISRVYVGVHYPRDILGGFLFSFLVFVFGSIIIIYFFDVQEDLDNHLRSHR